MHAALRDLIAHYYHCSLPFPSHTGPTILSVMLLIAVLVNFVLRLKA